MLSNADLSIFYIQIFLLSGIKVILSCLSFDKAINVNLLALAGAGFLMDQWVALSMLHQKGLCFWQCLKKNVAC